MPQVAQAAADELRLNGFDRTSMDAVAARAGVSKATIYSYFTNKEEMFASVIQYEVEELQRGIAAIECESERDIRAQLSAVGQHLLSVWLSPRTLPLLRTLISEAIRFEELATRTHRTTRQLFVSTVAGLLETAVSRGQLECANIPEASNLFMSLMSGDLTLAALLEPASCLEVHAFASHADWAVEILLKTIAAT